MGRGSMYTYLARRFMLIIPTLLGILLILSIMLEIIPGDPVTSMLSETATKEMREAVREQLGLDKPFLVRYGVYVWKAAAGDFGRSYLRGKAVVDIVARAFPATLQLAASSLLLTVLIGFPLGIISALHPHGLIDHLLQGVGALGVSMPAFWIGLLLIYAFAYTIPLFPIGGRDGLVSLVLPAITLSLAQIGFLMGVVRANVLQVMEEDFVRTARAKGLSEQAILVKHAIRNALYPIVTIIGLAFGRQLGGAVVTEVVFAWPGMGRLIVNAVLSRDYPVIQGGILVFGLGFMLVNLIVDLLYAVLNPKVRYN